MPTIRSRGIATSGRHGRSFSLGIADAVTVLARDGRRRPMPRATIIANAVDLPGHPAIVRLPGQRVAARQRPRRAAGHPRRRPLDAEARSSRRSDAGAARARAIAPDAGLIEGAGIASTGRNALVVGTTGHRGAGDRDASQEATIERGCMHDRERGRNTMSAIIRKIVTVVEETHLEMGKTSRRRRRGGPRRSP